jgi:hypothetical protein
MANGKNLSQVMPAKASFVFGTSGATDKPATKIQKGGDLRAKKGNNNGK